ncbi:MAG: hypothetical protein AAGE92_16905, partial [Cyanobacteria bacterium P01_G01_bin.4]
MGRRGAGGSNGGVMRFLMGLAMMIGGGYLFFSSITVVNNFSLGYRLTPPLLPPAPRLPRPCYSS